MSMYEAEAKIDVASPGSVIKDAWDSDLNVSVTKVPGEPRTVYVRGSYESVTAFLIEYLTMSPEEADSVTKVKGEEEPERYRDGEPVEAGWNQRADEVSSFDKYMDNILIKESKQIKQGAEDTPQRILAKRHRETTANRITFGSKK